VTTFHQRHARAVDDRDLAGIYRLNNDFHNLLFEACGNPHLVEAIAHYAWLAHAVRSYRIADPALVRRPGTSTAR
jgi:DNA-binding GntR family transcriptional regulator